MPTSSGIPDVKIEETNCDTNLNNINVIPDTIDPVQIEDNTSNSDLKKNVNADLDETSWISCAGQLENLINDFNLCGVILTKLKNDTLPNPIIFLLESIQIISIIKSKAKQYLINAKNVSQKMSSTVNENQNYVFDDLISHDPGKRDLVTSSPQRKYLINLGPYQPKLSKFPINKSINESKQNRFNPKWYCEYPLLEYSMITNAAYCFACTLFPKGPGRQSSDLAWISKGVNQWHKMKSRGAKKLGKLEQHFSCLSHKAALHDYCHFMSQSNHIDLIMNKHVRVEAIKIEQEKEFNKQVILILIDVARTLSRQGLAFRGDGNEDGGNFNQFVKLISRHNPVINRWLNETSMRQYHVTYLGPRSQNEFIDILAAETRNIVVQEILKANIFSVMADTTPDISNKDRLAVCVRYVNDNGEATERLLEISEGMDKTGLGTAKQIICILENNGLNTDNIAFQSYDFASNMSGAQKGAHAQLSKLVGHKIPFIPCQAHRLNTYLEHSCEASSIISNMVDILESIYVFFSSSTKRYGLLNTYISKVENSLHLRNLSRTRWTARAESVKAVWSSLEAISNCLQEIQFSTNSFDRNTRTKALGLRKKILSFDFIVSLSFMKNIMYKLKSLTETLESQNLSLVDAAILIDTAITSLEDINSSTKSMDNLIESSSIFAKVLGVDSKSDFLIHHRNRKAPGWLDSNTSNQTEFTMQLFYRKEFKSVLDTLINLSKDNLKSCISTFKPLFEIFKQPLEISNLSLINIKNSILLFPPKCNGSKISDFDAVKSEIEILFNMMNTEDLSVVKSLNDIMQKSELVKNILPLSNLLCRLAYTAPVTVASNERTFSKLKLIKNHLRSTTSDERLNSLMILSTEKDVVDNLDILKIAEHWATLKQRRIKI